MSLSVVCVNEHVNHSDGEKSFGYMEDSHDSEQMLEIVMSLWWIFVFQLWDQQGILIVMTAQ